MSKRNIVTVALTDEMAEILDEARTLQNGKKVPKADMFRQALFFKWLPQMGMPEPEPMPLPQSKRVATRPDHAARMRRYRDRKKREKRSEEARVAEMEAKTRTRMIENAGESVPLATRRPVHIREPEQQHDEEYYETYTSSRGFY